MSQVPSGCWHPLMADGLAKAAVCLVGAWVVCARAGRSATRAHARASRVSEVSVGRSARLTLHAIALYDASHVPESARGSRCVL